MLEFKLHQFQAGPRYYALLPKLSPSQVSVVERHLRSRGFSVSHAPNLVATKGAQTIHISASGFSWSSSDQIDAIAPVIPAVLEAEKLPISLAEMKEMYFQLRRPDRSIAVRLTTRVESGLWKHFRTDGTTGLTPDEAAVARFFVEHSRKCSLLADFATSGGRSTMIGRRQYYEADLSPKQASSSLHDFATLGRMNSYLPKTATLSIQWSVKPKAHEFTALLDGLGDWCGFTLSERKSSNW